MRTSSAILRAVAAVTGVPVRALRARGADRRTSSARQLAAFVLMAEGHTSRATGEALHRDHKTVLYLRGRFVERAAMADLRAVRTALRHQEARSK